MSDIEDVKVMAEHIDDHLWWLGELDQYGLPDNFVQYFLATRPSKISGLLVDVDEYEESTSDLKYDNENLRDENQGLEAFNRGLEDERDEALGENSSLHDYVLELENTVEDLRSEIEALNKYINDHVDDDLED